MEIKSEKQLILEYRGGSREALDELFEMNKNLIYFIYNRHFRKSGCPKEDMTQEGYIGLYEAIKRSHPSKHKQFNSYKSLWIKKKMFDFRKKQFKLNTAPLGKEHELIEKEQTSSEKLRMAIFELDNLVGSGKIPLIRAKKLLIKTIKGTR